MPDREAEREPPGTEKGRSGAISVSEPDAVEAALAQALVGATAAGQWDVVGKLAAELEARRRARLEVPDLAAERAKRGKR